MTPLQLKTEIRFRTQTDSNTFPDADILRMVNIQKDRLADEAIRANEDLFGMVSTRDLVASSTGREYSLPNGLVKIKSVEAKLNGTDWVHLLETDVTRRQRATDEATIIADFTNDEGVASYDVFRNSLWLYTGTISATVADGLKLWMIIRPADLIDLTLTTDMSIDPSTTTFGIPTQFHLLLTRLVSRDFKQSGDRSMALAQDEQEVVIKEDIERAVMAVRNMNLSRAFKATLPVNEYDNGYDL